jgi:CheY-like chemotaxis protein
MSALIPNAPRHRILVIDDNRAIHEDFRKIFNSSTDTESLAAAEANLFGDAPEINPSGLFQIDSAYQGQEGLSLVTTALAAGKPYAMAFVDMRMPPGWDGLETIARIWAVYPDLQVVICTAYSDYTWTEITQKLGVTDQLMMLKKPFDNVEVLQMASALTKRWESVQQTRQQIDRLEATLARHHAELRRRAEPANRTEPEVAPKLVA